MTLKNLLINLSVLSFTLCINASSASSADASKLSPAAFLEAHSNSSKQTIAAQLVARGASQLKAHPQDQNKSALRMKCFAFHECLDIFHSFEEWQKHSKEKHNDEYVENQEMLEDQIFRQKIIDAFKIENNELPKSLVDYSHSSNSSSTRNAQTNNTKKGVKRKTTSSETQAHSSSSSSSASSSSNISFYLGRQAAKNANKKMKAIADQEASRSSSQSKKREDDADADAEEDADETESENENHSASDNDNDDDIPLSKRNSSSNNSSSSSSNSSSNSSSSSARSLLTAAAAKAVKKSAGIKEIDEDATESEEENGDGDGNTPVLKGKGEFICRIDGCSAKFDNNKEVYEHCNAKHELCQTCKEYAKTANDNHTCSAKKIWRCHFNECQKTCKKQSELTAHDRTHTGERPHKCLDCGATFPRKKNLTSHIISQHDGEKSYKCSDCPATFTTSSERGIHHRTHTGERPYKCTHKGCTKDFKSKRSLKEHVMRAHTGERPHKCTDAGCNKAFTASNDLKRHIRVHTGVKPYKCECPYAAAQIYNLTRHMRSHTGERPYKCSTCPYAAKDPSTLERHEKTHASKNQLNKTTK